MSPRPKNIRKVNDMPVTAGFKPIGLNGCCTAEMLVLGLARGDLDWRMIVNPASNRPIA